MINMEILDRLADFGRYGLLSGSIAAAGKKALTSRSRSAFRFRSAGMDGPATLALFSIDAHEDEPLASGKNS